MAAIFALQCSLLHVPHRKHLVHPGRDEDARVGGEAATRNRSFVLLQNKDCSVLPKVPHDHLLVCGAGCKEFLVRGERTAGDCVLMPDQHV